jgi:hypothetical protein
MKCMQKTPTFMQKAPTFVQKLKEISKGREEMTTN